MENRLIKYEGVRITQASRTILKDVNFTLDKGEFVYILGEVGSGKSSLIRSFYGDLPVNSGIVRVLGRNMKQIKLNDIATLRRRLGVIFQDFQLLYDRTVYANLDFVLKATGWSNKKERQQRIAETLDLVDMVDKEGRMPYELSGGEQQRVAVARAILNNPNMIIADEPTGNLSHEISNYLMQLFKRIQEEKGTAIVMATHDLRLLNDFPAKAYVCKDGAFSEYES